MKRLLHYLLIHPLAALLLVVLLGLGGLVVLAASSGGTQFLAKTASRFVPGLTLEGVAGALIRDVRVEHLQWRDTSTEIEAAGVRLQHTLDLGVSSTLQVEQLAIERLVIRLQPSTDDAEAGGASGLPVNLDVRQADIKWLEIWRNGKVYRLQDVRFRGKGTRAALDVAHLQMKVTVGDVAEGEVSGSGWLDWADGLSWDAKLHGEHINPASFAQDAPGDLTVDLRSQGKWGGDKPQLAMDIARLEGRLRDYPVNAKAKGEWDGKQLSLAKLDVHVGNNQLQASGKVGETYDLRWQLDAKNLAAVWKGLEGNLKGSGTLGGRLDAPQIQADLNGGNIRYQDYRLATLTAQAQQTGDSYNIKAAIDGFQAGKTVLKTLQLEGQGTLENHRLRAQLDHAEGKVAFAADGSWKNEQWQGSVQQLALRNTVAGDWNMTQAVNLAASATAFGSSEICLASKGGRLCGTPEWKARQGFAVTGTVQQLPLAMLRPWLSEGIAPTGTLSADYRFDTKGGKPSGQLDARLAEGSITLNGVGDKAETLHYQNVRAKLVLDNRQLTMDAQADLKGYGQIRADGGVAFSPADGQHRLDLRVTANMPDIAWLERYSPQIEQLHGSAMADLHLGGVASQPRITGSLKLVNGQVHLPEAGITLDAIQLTLQSNGTNRATVVGSARAGQGILTANGVLSLGNLPRWEADVSLQGDRLKLMDTHEIQAWVSPHLQLHLSPASVTVSGSVLIPQATVSLREIPATANVRSSDVVIVGKRALPQRGRQVVVKDTPLDITPDVTLELGDKVTFAGFGLDARLTGKLRVLRTKQDIVADGVLSVVDGFYKAYGQNLTIEKGRLLFSGALDNPGLDVRAVREVDGGDIKVGIALAGTVRKPESTLFSTPQQTQSDTLSYLLTGRAMSGISGDQSSLLMRAVNQLGVAGGEGLIQQLGGNLGLDSVDLKSKDGNFSQSELSLGKRLGPRLYVRYIVSLFDSLQQVALTYQVNKRLQLEAKSGLNQSLDLIYKLDTNWGPLGP